MCNWLGWVSEEKSKLDRVADPSHTKILRETSLRCLSPFSRKFPSGSHPQIRWLCPIFLFRFPKTTTRELTKHLSLSFFVSEKFHSTAELHSTLPSARASEIFAASFPSRITGNKTFNVLSQTSTDKLFLSTESDLFRCACTIIHLWPRLELNYGSIRLVRRVLRRKLFLFKKYPFIYVSYLVTNTNSRACVQPHFQTFQT